MNFYKRYPADYGKKTARLTLAQHGAYTLLLDEIYTSEAGLPVEHDELYRICRAMNKGEQEAVRAVAEKFFPIGGDGLRHNNRATEELIEAAPAIEAARANGKKGGRPRKETQQKPSGFSEGNPDETQSEPRTKAPHSSDNSLSLRSREPRATRKCPASFTVSEDLRAWASQEAPGVDLERETAKFRDHTFKTAYSDWDGTWRNWMRKATEFAPRNGFAQPSGETAYQRTMRERMEGFAPGIAARPPGQPRPLTVIEEVQDVPAIASR